MKHLHPRLNKISEVSVEQLFHAYNIAANIVTVFGDNYLPIFERLHKEIEEYQRKHNIKKLALQLALGHNCFG